MYGWRFNRTFEVHPQNDALDINLSVRAENKFTKTKVLSIIAKIFNPLGLLDPIVTTIKTLIFVLSENFRILFLKGYSYASELVYDAVIYAVSQRHLGRLSFQLLCSKDDFCTDDVI